MLRKVVVLVVTVTAVTIVGFAAPDAATAATTAPAYDICPTAPIFQFGDAPIHIEPCYSISPRDALGDTVLQLVAVRTALEAWNPYHARWETVSSKGWWHQIAQSGASGYANNGAWWDQANQPQYGNQCYWLTWAQYHPFGNFAHYWRLRVDFAWGTPFTFTSPVPTGYVGVATQYDLIGWM
jgi:hypothetical protein